MVFPSLFNRKYKQPIKLTQLLIQSCYGDKHYDNVLDGTMLQLKFSALYSTGMSGTLSVQTKLSTIKKNVQYYINFKLSMK